MACASFQMEMKDCLCGKRECKGITSAFLLLNDSRSGFTSLPRKSETDHEMNGLRNAYIRYMFPDAELLEEMDNDDNVIVTNENTNSNEKKKTKYYIANHHFHPAIVRESTDIITKEVGSDDGSATTTTTKIIKARIPMYISLDDLTSMGIGPNMSDLVMDGNGLPAGDYYYVTPCYTLEKARKDAATEAKVQRMIHERQVMMMNNDSIACMTTNSFEEEEEEETKQEREITTTAEVEHDEELSLSKVAALRAATPEENDPSYIPKKQDLNETQSLSLSLSSSSSSKALDANEPQAAASSGDESLRGHDNVGSIPETTIDGSGRSHPTVKDIHHDGENEVSSYDDSLWSSPSCNLPPIDGGANAGTTMLKKFHILQKYEFKRRETRQENVKQEFQSMLQMLEYGTEECLQYEHLLHGMAAANRQYAMALKSISNNYPNDGRSGSHNRTPNGSIPAATAVAESTKKGFQTLFRRGKQSMKQHVHNANTTTTCESSKLTTVNNEASDTANDSSSPETNNVTSSVLHVHSVLADELNESAKHIADKLLPEMTHYREKLEYKVNHDIKKKGMNAIDLIESAESLVIKAWDSYYDLAAEKMGDHMIHSNSHGDSSVSSNSDTSASLESSFPSSNAPRYTSELWVKELHYRAIVKMFTVGKQKWDNLRKEVATIESERQMKVQEVLLSYLPRQRRAFSTFSELQKPILNNLMTQNTASSGVGDVENLQHETSGVNDISLSPIMDGGTVMHVEREIGRDTWHRTLAVMSDSLLHLFHIPSTISQTTLTSPVETFENLVSPLYEPLKNPNDNKYESPSTSNSVHDATKIAQKIEAITPFHSFYLPKCKIGIHSNGREVEIDDGDSFARTVVKLRTSSKIETSTLLDSNRSLLGTNQQL